jgi:TonB family protein
MRAQLLAWSIAAAGLVALVAAPVAAQQGQVAEIVAPTRLDPEPVPYPPGATGDAAVVLQLTLQTDGTVERVVVQSGDAPFAEAARLAAERWRFTPATRNGIPVRAKIAARVAFHPPAPPEAPAAAETPASTAAPAETSANPPAPKAPPADAVEVRVVGEGREELGSTHIPRHETRLVPGAFADPFRVVEVLPGVAPILSGIPYFTVRGAPPGDVGYSIDGVRVPLLFHVGAGPSVIAPGFVDRVDLYPGVYPARFGRAAAGIMAGETTPPGDVARGEGQARVFDAGGMVEQPFADKRANVAFGGRYGYTGALLSLVAPDYDLAYWDYQARAAYKLTENDRLTVFAFGASDFLRNKVLARTLFDVQFHRLDLRWDRETDTGRVRVAATLSSDHTLNAQENATDPGSGTTSSGARLRTEIEQRIARGLRVRAGGDVGVEHFTRDDEVLANGFTPFGPHDDFYGSAWVDLVARPGAGVEIVPAFRTDAFRVRGKSIVSPEPRLAARLGVAEGVAWISAFGVTHQAPTFLVPVPGTAISVFDSSNQQVWQASESLEVALPARMLAKVTLFRDVSILEDTEGISRNYGAELFLRRDFTERLGGFLSYTLSRADRERDSATNLSTFDRPHVLSVVLGYDLGAGYRLGGRFFAESGRPYTVACPTPDCGPANVANAPRVAYLVAGRLPMFSRLDVRFEKKWRLGDSASIAATFEWFNALLAKELDTINWTPRGLVTTGRSPLTLPSVGVEASY